MLKQLLLFILTIPFAVCASPIKRDTAVMFFNSKGFPVRTLDSADYYMLILPPSPPDDHYNIQEFYKNGQVKLIGKGDAKENSMRTGVVRLDGDCTTYYPDGSKSAFIHYNQGYKDGVEQLYYPNGNILSRIKHRLASSSIYNETFYWDCYDDRGTMICKEGNGKWIKYDDSGKYIKLEGQIKNGYMEGDWTGKVFLPDTIKYTYRYKRSLIQLAVGYDKNGRAYPFGSDFEAATYRSGPLVFLERLRNHIKLPSGINSEKSSLDTIHVSFTVEKDGKLSQFSVTGDADSLVKGAVFKALAQSNEWIPSKIYGVPFRTRIILPLSEISGWNTKYKGWESYHKEIFFKEK